MTTNHNHQNQKRNYQPGTKVISNQDVEPGTIVGVCTYRRNGVDAWSYLVDTAYGREVWETSEFFLQPANDQD